MTNNSCVEAGAANAAAYVLVNETCMPRKRRVYVAPQVTHIKISSTEYGIKTENIDATSPMGLQHYYGKPGGLGS